MNNAEGSGVTSFFRRAWRIIRWPLGILVVAYLALVVYEIPKVSSKEKSQQTVALIQSKHLTLEDVDGKHLPPPPDPKLVDATIEGIDANKNGIRDDVELAIFKKYPNSPYTRAAELQYAMAQQVFLTNVFSSETWIVATQEKGRGYGCLFDATAGVLSTIQERTKEVENFVFNTDMRKQIFLENGKYRTSFSLLKGADCDIDVQSLTR